MRPSKSSLDRLPKQCAEHLKAAFAVAYGEYTPKVRTQFETYRHILRAEHDGVERVIRTLAYQRDRRPRRNVLATELGYFRRNRARMGYAPAIALGLPIGSELAKKPSRAKGRCALPGAWVHR